MKSYLETERELILQEAKDELDLCNLNWDDSFIDYLNNTPLFDIDQEENRLFFYGCMAKIECIDKVLEFLEK